MKEYTVLYKKCDELQVIYLDVENGESLIDTFEREACAYYADIILISRGKIRVFTQY